MSLEGRGRGRRKGEGGEGYEKAKERIRRV